MISRTGRAAAKRAATAAWGMLCMLVVLAAVAPGSALAAGGTSIASAPTVAYGVQEFGNTATDQYLEDSCGFLIGAHRSYWLLPVLAGDKLTINWEGTEGTELKISPVGTTDFTYFQGNPVVSEYLGSNGKSQTQYTAPVTGAMPMTFRVCDLYKSVPGPYDFTATVQHGLSASLTPTTNIYRKSAIGGRASLADGTPAPDGLVFNLVAKWHSGDDLHRAAVAAASVGGGLSFQLKLPTETAGKTVRLVVGRAENSAYQAARSVPLKVKVAGRKHHRHRHHNHHNRH